MDKIKIRLNADLRGFLKGKELIIDIDSAGNPTDAFWRGRLKDSAIDNCIEIVENKQITKDKRAKGDKKEKSIKT
jgi:hypothetical protein